MNPTPAIRIAISSPDTDALMRSTVASARRPPRHSLMRKYSLTFSPQPAWARSWTARSAQALPVTMRRNSGDVPVSVRSTFSTGVDSFWRFICERRLSTFLAAASALSTTTSPPPARPSPRGAGAPAPLPQQRPRPLQLPQSPLCPPPNVRKYRFERNARLREPIREGGHHLSAAELADDASVLRDGGRLEREQVLHRDRRLFHAHDFAHVQYAAGTIRKSREVDDQVEGRGHLLADRAGGQF